ncbi:hypothetical protein OV450_6680 [Actinobacteria bacterium OV450]|nr:hypothetical protein OV450_6680 [Actinobacteria bacterium OV450]
MLVALGVDIRVSVGAVARFVAVQSLRRRASAEEGRPACRSSGAIAEVAALPLVAEVSRGRARAVLAELRALGDSMEEDGTAAEDPAGDEVLGEPARPRPVTG